MTVFQSAILESLAFFRLLAATIVLPGMLMLYHDWRNRKGWFHER